MDWFLKSAFLLYLSSQSSLYSMFVLWHSANPGVSLTPSKRSDTITDTFKL